MVSLEEIRRTPCCLDTQRIAQTHNESRMGFSGSRGGVFPGCEKDVEWLAETVFGRVCASGLMMFGNVDDADVTLELQKESLLRNLPRRKPLIAPVTLLPSPFPEECFRDAQKLMLIFNEMTDIMTSHPSWLYSALERAADDDAVFTGRLMQLCKDVYGDSHTPGRRDISNDIRLIITRSDYMVDKRPGSTSLLQVEINNIAVSLNGLTEKLSDIHRHIFARLAGISESSAEHWMPLNKPCTRIAKSLLSACRLYAARYKPIRPLCVLTVVYPYDRNTTDQRILESTLQSLDADLAMQRMTPETFWSHWRDSFDAQDPWQAPVVFIPSGSAQPLRLKATTRPADLPAGKILIRSESGVGLREVALVYYRCGYTPEEYERFPKGWDVREIMEVSDAVKVPSALCHLSGVKKIQSLWRHPAVVREILHLRGPMSDSDAFDVEEKARRVVAVTADQADPSDFQDDTFTAELVREGLAHPERFLLKPLREGGGNLIHGDDIVKTLKSEFVDVTSAKSEFGAKVPLPVRYILMRKISPPKLLNLTFDRELLHSQHGALEITALECISELGIYGIVLTDGRGREQRVYLDEYSGYLLRTKGADVAEGGVASGFSMMDTLYLCPLHAATNQFQLGAPSEVVFQSDI